MDIIKVTNLSKSYIYYKKEKGLMGSLKNMVKKEMLFKEAVKNITFKVREGSIVGFVGLNGAGKTTTLKMLSGILKPTDGSIEIYNFNPFNKKTEFLKKITMVMGNKSQLWWDIPAIETFEFNKVIFGVEKTRYKEILDNLVETLDVKHLLNVQVRRLSLGERMKMELIAALIHSPSVLFLDEPTIGLDIISQHSIREFLKVYNKENKTTIILTSHNFEDIVYLCDELILIDSGQIIYNNSFKSFLDENSNKKVLTIKFNVDSRDILADILDESVELIQQKDDEIKISVEESKVVGITHQLTSNYFNVLKDISIENLDIKEIVKNIYSKSSKKERLH